MATNGGSKKGHKFYGNQWIDKGIASAKSMQPVITGRIASTAKKAAGAALVGAGTVLHQLSGRTQKAINSNVSSTKKSLAVANSAKLKASAARDSALQSAGKAIVSKSKARGAAIGNKPVANLDVMPKNYDAFKPLNPVTVKASKVREITQADRNFARSIDNLELRRRDVAAWHKANLERSIEILKARDAVTNKRGSGTGRNEYTVRERLDDNVQRSLKELARGNVIDKTNYSRGKPATPTSKPRKIENSRTVQQTWLKKEHY
jgi:hypothetical protein